MMTFELPREVGSKLWHDFKTDPPYDAYEDMRSGVETDDTYAWFVYVYTHRPSTMNCGPFLSHKACCFSNGVFEGYEHHSQSSLHPTDRIEVIAWAEDHTVRGAILDTFERLVIN